jgi:hypothetical protein
MQRKIERKLNAIGKQTEKRHERTMNMSARGRTSMSSYTKALKEAGIEKDDLQLLRELAEINAGELSQPYEHKRPVRVFL